MDYFVNFLLSALLLSGALGLSLLKRFLLRFSRSLD